MLENTIILVVDHNPDDEALKLRGFKRNGSSKEVTVARDGVEALDYLFTTGVYSASAISVMAQIIVSDQKLPKIDGLEIVRCLRASDRTKLMPVAILPSSKEELNPIDSYDLGCNSYICKRLDIVELNEAVNNLSLYWLNLNQQPSKTRRS